MKKTLSIAIAALVVGGFAALGAAATPRMAAAMQQEAVSDGLAQVRARHHGGHRGHGGYRRHGGHRWHGGHYGRGYRHHGYADRGYRHHGYRHYRHGYRHHYYDYDYDYGYGYGYYPAPFFGFFPGVSICVGGGYWGFYGCGW